MLRMNRIGLLLAMLLVTGGCNYRGVGDVQIYQEIATPALGAATVAQTAGAAAPAEPELQATFDDLLYRKDGQETIITAYRKVQGRRGKFNSYFGDYKKDFPFITLDLTVRLSRDGVVTASPYMRMLHDERVLWSGPLAGDVRVIRAENGLLQVTGQRLMWSIDGDVPGPREGPLSVTFELRTYDIAPGMDSPPPPPAPATPTATAIPTTTTPRID